MSILGTFHKNQCITEENNFSLINAILMESAQSWHNIIYVLYIFRKHKTRQKRWHKTIQGGPFKKEQVGSVT